MFIGAHMYCSRFRMEVAKHVEPLPTRSDGYDIMTEISNGLLEICSDRYLIELNFNSDYNLKNALLLIRIAGKIDW